MLLVLIAEIKRRKEKLKANIIACVNQKGGMLKLEKQRQKHKADLGR